MGPRDGPLAPYAEGLAGELARRAFKPSSARLQMQVAAHLSRWLAQAGLERRRWTAR
jgi:hypothetical protein